jgi:hypothetical protein
MYKVYVVGYILFHYTGVHSNDVLQKQQNVLYCYTAALFHLSIALCARCDPNLLIILQTAANIISYTVHVILIHSSSTN